MNDVPQQVALARALAVARVRAFRTTLLGLHKALIDAERRRYEREHGRIEHAQAALRLVIEDPWFRWLAPLANAIVQIDERLADEDTPLGRAEAERIADRLRGLLQREDGDAVFRAEYRRSLQETPEVVLAHARVVKLLAEEC